MKPYWNISIKQDLAQEIHRARRAYNKRPDTEVLRVRQFNELLMREGLRVLESQKSLAVTDDQT